MIKYCVKGIVYCDIVTVEVTSETLKTIVGLRIGPHGTYGSPVRVRKDEAFDTMKEANVEYFKRYDYLRNNGKAMDYHKSNMPAKPKKQPSVQKTKKVPKIDTSHVKVFSDDDSGEIAF